jgi:hypothetical protein
MTHPERPVKEALFRGARATVEEPIQISRSGGDYQAGLLSGVSLIATGEALGHDMWIDEVTLEQVAQYANQGKHGVKSRFTHPSMSADGMGRHLGRIKNVRVDGYRVLGDLHFAQSAHATPEGDLAEYVMTLAEEDPAAAGLSIVFEHDQEAEQEFIAEHSSGKFASPDANNTKNFPHVRLEKLRAADIVDEPAANPDGLFDRQTLARDVDELLSYAAGISVDKPKSLAFGVDADRASQFLGRWLERHQLSIVSRNEEISEMSEATEIVEAGVSDSAPASFTREDFLSELSAYVDRFGSENGQKWFSEGIELQEALGRQCDLFAEQIEQLKAELSEAKEQLAAAASVGEDPIDVGEIQANDNKKRLSEFFNNN